MMRRHSADSIRDKSKTLHTKSGCMAAIFTFSKSSNESLAKVGVHVWNTDIKDKQGQWSDAQKQACAPTVAKVKAEMDTHKLRGEPSKSGSDAPHVQRKAVDIDEAVVDAIKAKVGNTTYITFIPPFCFFCMPIPVHIGDVQDYVNSPLVNPPPCKLRWGGRFKGKKYDPVHFDLFLQ